MQLASSVAWLAALAALASLFGPSTAHARDSVVVFNEVHYHPLGEGQDLEWIELHNQMAVDIELSAWRIDGGIQFDFPLGTVIPGGGYLVVARNPQALEAATGFSNALGPFTGALANGGEEILLYNHNRLQPNPELSGRRIMDRLDYGDNAPWPVAPDGSGVTLAKLDPDTGTGQPRNWTWSAQINGTPGATNFPAPDDVPLEIVTVLEVNSQWRFNESGEEYDDSWAQTQHGTGGNWREGAGAFGFESKLDDIIVTPLIRPTSNQPYVATHYFETDFEITTETLGRIAHLNISHLIDDGAVIYINGEEIQRYNMPAGNVDFETLASGGTEGEWITVEKLNAASLLPGTNRISVEVHQSSFGSSDVVFGLSLDLALGPPPSGDQNFSQLALNEISAANGNEPLAIELLNDGDQTLQLDGIVLSISADPNREWTIRNGTSLAAGEWFIAENPALVATDQDRIFILSPNRQQVIDARQASASLRGRVPHGEFSGRWLVPSQPTFGSENVLSLETNIVINEIFYHAYPERGFPDIPPQLGDSIVLPLASQWRFNENTTGEGLPEGWAQIDHPEWPEGLALLGREPSALEEPIRTALSFSRPQITYYFETDFTFEGDVSTGLTLKHFIDDGAIFYLNGAEIARFNMPAGLVTPETLADSSVSNAEAETLTIDEALLVEGNNRLAVEVHQSNIGSSDIVFGVEILAKTVIAPGIPGQPYSEPDEEWIELVNTGSAPVDLSGWSLQEGINFAFPDGSTIGPDEYVVIANDKTLLHTKYPDISIVGSFSGRLANGGERLLLADSSGNPADEVTYFDSGRWPQAPDAGGSSLELRDANARNSIPEAWAASTEGEKSQWRTYTYRGIAENDRMGNNVFHEFLLGLLDDGELLLDDISVVEDPDGAAIEFIQNGSFETDTEGELAESWRAVGTHGSHGRTLVAVDPDNPSNRCLHLVATGPTGDKHNKIETTFANRERVTVGTEYQISFRAKWLTGSNQVNTRLYFNYLQKTTLIDVPTAWGTPGIANSTRIENSGPTFSDLAHQPAVPDDNEPVTVSVVAEDPDGIGTLSLHYSVEDADFTSVPMSLNTSGTYTATIPGQPSNMLVQFYVEGTDSRGNVTQFPAKGANSRALFKSDDGRADLENVHNLRILMLDEDRSFLFRNTNRMSNDRLRATVIYDEITIFHDVGVRLKGSAFGRYNQQHHGFNIEFDPDHRFRGVHRTISIERSPPLKEMLAKHLLTQGGGGTFSAYEDVGCIITPNERESGPCLFSMARHSSEYWEGLFDNPGDGTLFNHELLYNPNGSSGGTQGLKINNPYNHTNGRYDFRDRGETAEPYRFGFQIRSNRSRDDYSAIIGASKALSLSGQAMEDAAEQFIDFDQFGRGFAALSLVGNDDTYTRVWEHNLRYYQRPTDGRLIVLPWDLDRGFQLATSAPAIGGNNMGKLLKRPRIRRLFDGHALDLAETTFNREYATQWADHYRTLTGSSYAAEARYIGTRADYIVNRLPDESVFEITTNDGQDHTVNSSTIAIQGNGWINVSEIRRPDGSRFPMQWIDDQTWEITTTLQTGENHIEVEAIDRRGSMVGSDSIRITSTAISALNPRNIAISEIHYHPADPADSEIASGFTDADQFEFIELENISSGPIDLSGARFTEGIQFEFPSPSPSLVAGERILLVADEAAFRFRYGNEIATGIAGNFSGQLRNSGERLRLEDAAGNVVLEFEYNDRHPWPESADGMGASLVLLAPESTPEPQEGSNWRPSTTLGGNPGSTDRIPFDETFTDITEYALVDADQPFVTVHDGQLAVAYQPRPGADDALIVVAVSNDLENWKVIDPSAFAARQNVADGSEALVFQLPVTSAIYVRLLLQPRIQSP